MKKIQDMVGRKFYRLVVLASAHDRHRKWLCRCDCGTEKIIREQSLCRGITKSCGCYQKEEASKRLSRGWSKILTKDYIITQHIENKKSLREIAKEVGCTIGCIMRYMRKYDIKANDPFYDIVGNKYGKLKVISMSHTENGNSYWNTECDCGNKKIVQGKSLVRHRVVSCGCWNKEKCWQGVGNLSKSYWSKQVKSAIKRKIDFSITIEYAWELFEKQNSRCALSGRELIMDKQYGWNSSNHNSPQTASLDRIDSSIGYIEGNVQWVHTKINRMKNNLPEEEFIQMCREIANHINS